MWLGWTVPLTRFKWLIAAWGNNCQSFGRVPPYLATPSGGVMGILFHLLPIAQGWQSVSTVWSHICFILPVFNWIFYHARHKVVCPVMSCEFTYLSRRTTWWSTTHTATQAATSASTLFLTTATMTERERESIRSPALCFDQEITETAQVSYTHVPVQLCSALFLFMFLFSWFSPKNKDICSLINNMRSVIYNVDVQ